MNTPTPEDAPPPPHPAAPFPDVDCAAVWSYWFARRSLGRGPAPAVDPFADGYAFDHPLWFHAGPEVDAEIAARFGPLIAQTAAGERDAWLSSARGCLALILLLDQFPRHTQRGTAGAFAHDARALAITEHALARGFDRELSPAEALFFFLTLVHAEHLPAARRGLAGIEALITRCSRAQQRLARGWRTGTLKHIDLLERFGRYPHRNAALGRPDTPAEAAFLARPEFTALFMRSQLPARARPTGETSALDADNESRGGADTDARPSAKPGAARLKILALHGFRQNGEVFRKRTRKLRLALEDIADLTVVTSPLPYSPKGDTREATLAAFGYIPDYPSQRVWWLSSDDNREYEGFDTSLAFLETVFREQGPFDGVLGFAQGGTLAAVLAAMQPHPIITFSFAICLSAFPSRAEAHAAYMAPGSIKLPSIHALGLSDILVTNDRSLRLFEAFDPARSVLVEHPGGHFVPSAWPHRAIHAFAESFLPREGALAPEARPAALEADASDTLYRSACDALSARASGAALEVERLGADLRALSARGRWKELQAVAVQAHALRVETGDASLEGVHRIIVELFAEQLRRDLDAAASMPRRDEQGAQAERTRRLLGLLTTAAISEESRAPHDASPWPSDCARQAPRVGAQTDKRCHLARDIAVALFPPWHLAALIERMQQLSPPRLPGSGPPAPFRRRAPQNHDLPTQARRLAYQRYTQVKSLLSGILAEPERRTPGPSAPRFLPRETLEQLHARPLSTQVTDPEPEPVVPCLLDDLRPLLAHLRADAPVAEQTAFHKGTLTVDGRLDLCKQVVGPGGIAPLLDALRVSGRVQRLLLGNNIVGDGGAAAIARFLRERRGSPLTCWYIAGNHITAAGIELVCEALADDTTVTALWLKRNPLKPAGMAPLAALLRRNHTLEVLDLVNCGLLDEGLDRLLGALRGPGASRALRHLYLGTNGISARSAPALGDLLADDCALSSLYLSCNRLGDEGAVALAAALRHNRSLRRLSLSSNLIGPRGAWALAEALADHPTVELLDLGFTKATVAVGEHGNFLGDEGARAMAQLLAQTTRLRSLDLLHNGISQVGVNALREGLAHNRSLTSLQLTQFGKVHNEPGKEEIRAALARNRALLDPAAAASLAELELPTHIREIYSVYRTHL
jgi:uncharacterized protein (DUF924 family)/Ran GTPase-activating protein (RanGAP) involved in mRNA processing and transport